MSVKRFSVTTNEDYTLAVRIDGEKMIDSLTLNEAIRLRDNLTKALSGAKYEQALCRRQWVLTVANGYKIGSRQPLRVSRGVEEGEYFICLTTGKKNTPYLQYTVEGYIQQLAEKDRHKAREVFARTLGA